MKISVSLPREDVEFLDEFAGSHGPTSRSAAVQAAVELLRRRDLGAQYEDAMAEWVESGDGIAVDRASR